MSILHQPKLISAMFGALTNMNNALPVVKWNSTMQEVFVPEIGAFASNFLSNHVNIIWNDIGLTMMAIRVGSNYSN